MHACRSTLEDPTLHGPGGGLSAEANPPDDADIPAWAQGDAWFTHGNYESPKIGDFQSAAGVWHELGHAVGLKHGHQAGGGGNNINLPTDHDSQEYSIMTYRAYPGQVTIGNGQFNPPVDYPTTYMQDDVAALQWLYGADYSYNSTNTTYVWNPNTGEMLVNGKHQNAASNIFGGVPVHNKIFMTVWDGGGNDTYNFANYTTKVKVDLNPGGWSSPSTDQLADLGDGHTARGSIANALTFINDFRAYIENAIGGSNDDTMIGNVVNNKLYGQNGADFINTIAGNDYLYGGQGADILAGGPGRDIFDYNAITETGKTQAIADYIRDFSHQQRDRIDLSGLDANQAAAGNQAFAFIAAQNFDGDRGDLHFRFLNPAGTANDRTIVEGDVNGDRAADFQIYLQGLIVLRAADFVL